MTSWCGLLRGRLSPYFSALNWLQKERKKAWSWVTWEVRTIWKKWDERKNNDYNICYYFQRKETEMKIYIFGDRIDTKLQITIKIVIYSCFSNYPNKMKIINLKKMYNFNYKIKKDENNSYVLCSYKWMCEQLCMSEHIYSS